MKAKQIPTKKVLVKDRINVRISRRAYDELSKRAHAEDRSMVAALDRILSV